MTARLPNWENLLHDYLESKRSSDMACAHFAAGAVEAMTGVDPIPHFRGRMKWVEDHLSEAVAELFPERPVAFARRGDIVLANDGLGIVVGDDAAFMGEDPITGEHGITLVPRSAWVAAWTVD